mmetsp:Transcript_36031/g.78614  ORF Transcript_36031/g.78614 Transcript_36031/m.78614 type:complete len:289 (-) Transcript_36031:57-923(-)
MLRGGGECVRHSRRGGRHVRFRGGPDGGAGEARPSQRGQGGGGDGGGVAGGAARGGGEARDRVHRPAGRHGRVRGGQPAPGDQPVRGGGGRGAGGGRHQPALGPLRLAHRLGRAGGGRLRERLPRGGRGGAHGGHQPGDARHAAAGGAGGAGGGGEVRADHGQRQRLQHPQRPRGLHLPLRADAQGDQEVGQLRGRGPPAGGGGGHHGRGGAAVHIRGPPPSQPVRAAREPLPRPARGGGGGHQAAVCSLAVGCSGPVHRRRHVVYERAAVVTSIAHAPPLMMLCRVA